MSLLEPAEVLAIADHLDPPPHPYSDDPIGWIEDRLGTYVWKGIDLGPDEVQESSQAGICLSVEQNRFTAVRACHGVGKSFISAAIAAWWIDTREDARVVTTAPSAHQVKSILWREIKRARRAAGLPGTITESDVPSWTIDGETVAFGRKPADYVDAEQAAASFQGIHALNLLVILDEADGIPQWLGDAVETLVTNEHSRVLAIGNPMDPTSWFAQSQLPGQDYNVIKIAAWDTPAYTGEEIPERLAELLVTKQWVDERRRRWGVGSPQWQGRVEAEYPDVSDDTLITPAMIYRAWEADWSGRAIKTPGRCGLDVARYGADESVLYHNRGGMIRLLSHWGKTETMETVGKVRELLEGKKGTVPINVDVVGLGAGVYDRLKEVGYPVIPFNGGERAYDVLRYRNRRAEAYWDLREAMERGEIDLDSEDLDLANELQKIKWKPTSSGQKQILSKDEIKKELGHSPDRADACCMATQFPTDWMNILRKTSVQAPTRPPRLADQTRPPEPEDLVSDLLDVSL